ITRRFASWYGRGFKRTALTTLKIAVLAPMPSASMRTTTAVNPRFLRDCRSAKRRSWARPLIMFVLLQYVGAPVVNTEPKRIHTHVSLALVEQCAHQNRRGCESDSGVYHCARTGSGTDSGVEAVEVCLQH